MKQETVEIIKLIASVGSIIAPALFGVFFYKIRDSIMKFFDIKFDTFKKEVFNHIDMIVQLKIQEHMLNDQSAEISALNKISQLSDDFEMFKKYVRNKFNDDKKDGF